jgi:hypothetical protein
MCSFTTKTLLPDSTGFLYSKNLRKVKAVELYVRNAFNYLQG